MTSHTPPGPAAILIVDDNADARRILTALLRAEGHRLLVARGGHEALRIVERVPDLALVLLDIMMPGMDGLEVCRRIRARESKNYLPVILASALSDEGHIVAGLAAGADDYMAKPLVHTEVLARVRAALRLKRALDQLLEARELAAVGAIAVALGHEINNPLTTVAGNLELTLASCGLAGRTRIRLRAALAAATRIRELVRRLVHIDKVATKAYVGSVRMLDIDNSCSPDDEHRAPLPPASETLGRP